MNFQYTFDILLNLILNIARVGFHDALDQLLQSHRIKVSYAGAEAWGTRGMLSGNG